LGKLKLRRLILGVICRLVILVVITKMTHGIPRRQIANNLLLRQEVSMLAGLTKLNLTTGESLEMSLIGASQGFLLLVAIMITIMMDLVGLDLVGLLTVGVVAMVGAEVGIWVIEMTAMMAVEVVEEGILKMMVIMVEEVATGGEGIGVGMVAAEGVEVAEMAVAAALLGMEMEIGLLVELVGVGMRTDLWVAIIGQMILTRRNHLTGVVVGVVLVVRKKKVIVGMIHRASLLGTKAQLRKGVGEMLARKMVKVEGEAAVGGVILVMKMKMGMAGMLNRAHLGTKTQLRKGTLVRIREATVGVHGISQVVTTMADGIREVTAGVGKMASLC
jgi:hypothetical protein